MLIAQNSRFSQPGLEETQVVAITYGHSFAISISVDHGQRRVSTATRGTKTVVVNRRDQQSANRQHLRYQ